MESKLVYSIEQNVYTMGAVVNSDDFKDIFVDKLLEVRDAVFDKYGEYPSIGVSNNTFSWFKRLFSKDPSYVDGWTPKFWLMPICVMDMKDGLFDFYVEG